MEKALKRGFLNNPDTKDEKSQKGENANKEGQVVSDKQGSSSTSSQEKDFLRRHCERLDQSNKRPETVPSSSPSFRGKSNEAQESLSEQTNSGSGSLLEDMYPRNLILKPLLSLLYPSSLSHYPNSDAVILQPESPGRMESLPSSYEIEVHPSADLIPQKVLKMYRELNQSILDQSSKFKEYQATHLENSKREILQTAELALGQVPEGQPKKALLLGIGNALDIPLQELAEKFDHLTVVELDRESAKGAIEKLSPVLQKKIKFIVADICGIEGEIGKKIQATLNRSKSLEAFVKGLGTLFEKYEKKVTESVPDFGNDYTFVCSQLVLSQLTNNTQFYADDIATNKFGQESVGPSETDVYKKKLRNLYNNVKKAHFDFLAKSVSPQGVIHLAYTPMKKERNVQLIQIPGDHSAMRYLPVRTNPVETTIVESSVITQAIMQANLHQVTEEKNWTFEHSPFLTFKVISHCLRPQLKE